MNTPRTEIERIATLIAIEAPWYPRSGSLLVRWELVTALRQELRKEAIDWRDLKALEERKAVLERRRGAG